MMIKHHTEAKNKQLQLALKPAVSLLSTRLEQQASETLKALESASNSDFDVAYINARNLRAPKSRGYDRTRSDAECEEL